MFASGEHYFNQEELWSSTYLSDDDGDSSDVEKEELDAGRQEALKEMTKHLTPDPITGEVEFTDIIQYINTHADDPLVKKYFSSSSKSAARKKEKRKQAVANFDPSTLRIQFNSAWLVSLEYSGLTSEERWDDKWNFEDEAGKKEREEQLKAPPQQTFQIYCYIREGPEAIGGGDDSRHVEEYIGLPTSQQVEDFVKVCMAMPMACWKPCIPQNLYFTRNLRSHEAALLPFLRNLPLPFSFLFETDEIHNRVREQDFKKAEKAFKKYIDLATKLKDEGNKAFQRGDRHEAVDKFQQAAEDLDKLLLKSISEEQTREAETRRLLAVCMGNCSAARMLTVDGEKDARGAVVDAERAIAADPTYAKAYIRLSRAHEALGEAFEAQNAIVQGLRHKELENHFGLADHLISLQTGGKGLQSLSDKTSFDTWVHRTLVEDEKSALMMKDIRGAWRRRCDDHGKKFGA